jgi:hypothetical protein
MHLGRNCLAPDVLEEVLSERPKAGGDPANIWSSDLSDMEPGGGQIYYAAHLSRVKRGECHVKVQEGSTPIRSMRTNHNPILPSISDCTHPRHIYAETRLVMQLKRGSDRGRLM